MEGIQICRKGSPSRAHKIRLTLGGGEWGRKKCRRIPKRGETGRDKYQSVPSPKKLFKARDLELPIFEGSLPSCSPHSAGYTRSTVHPYFPVANRTSPWPKHITRSLGNGVRKNGVRNRCPYRRCGVDTEILYRLSL